jgi:hypothetical protein
MAQITKIRTKERIKKTGEIFTHPELVLEILEKLPPELFSDPTKTFLDPAAGNGNFVIIVIAMKIEAGLTNTQALHTTYGVELMQDNVDECKKRLLKQVGDTPLHQNIVNHNIQQADSLTFDYDSWQPYPLDNSKPKHIKKLSQEEFIMSITEF